MRRFATGDEVGFQMPLTEAASAPTIQIRRVQDGAYLDFSDNVFRTSGWTTKTKTLASDGAYWWGVHTLSGLASDTEACVEEWTVDGDLLTDDLGLNLSGGAATVTGTVAANITKVGGYDIPVSAANGVLKVDAQYANGGNLNGNNATIYMKAFNLQNDNGYGVVIDGTQGAFATGSWHFFRSQVQAPVLGFFEKGVSPAANNLIAAISTAVGNAATVLFENTNGEDSVELKGVGGVLGVLKGAISSLANWLATLGSDNKVKVSDDPGSEGAAAAPGDEMTLTAAYAACLTAASQGSVDGLTLNSLELLRLNQIGAVVVLDVDGRPTQATYPDGTVVTYDYSTPLQLTITDTPPGN